ncbi:MAG: hypothetical protein DVB25_07395 [Verrucomicrobia bacterium]|nr:MAG: hypothetical protein DVB25_07395 [Verrucomicrobiota bacterium]
MSNTTQHSHNPGDPKRRRSRGGQNRRNNNQQNSRGPGHDSSYDRDNRGQAQNRNPNAQHTAPLRKYAPVRLKWWQKLLQLVGLYKAPTRPTPRPGRQPEAAKPAHEPTVKSNTRNVRSGEAEADTGGERRDGERRRERGPDRGQERGGDRNGGRGSERSRGGDRASVESARVYVGNLSYDVSESDLQDLFKGIGGVRNVEIVYNRSTHRSKGYGFVEMLHTDEAKRAVEVLHDQPFMGRKLTVSGAQSKGHDEREDKEEISDRPERPERPERRPRAAPVATEVAEVAPESLEATTEIATIIEPTPAPAAAIIETIQAPEAAVSDESAPAAAPAAVEPKTVVS